MDRFLKYWPIILALATLTGAAIAGVAAYLIEQGEERSQLLERVKQLEQEKKAGDKLIYEWVLDLVKKHLGHPHAGKDEKGR